MMDRCDWCNSIIQGGECPNCGQEYPEDTVPEGFDRIEDNYDDMEGYSWEHDLED